MIEKKQFQDFRRSLLNQAEALEPGDKRLVPNLHGSLAGRSPGHPARRWRWRDAACAAALLVLAGCQSTQVMTAVAATKLEARQVVALVYLQLPDPAIRQLPFAAGDIALAVARMRGRWPQLKPLLDAGEAGITADGFIARRERSDERDAAAALLRGENLDRQILYAAAAQEVGHGSNDQFGDWMPFERAAFAREWVAQAPAGWWVRDERHAWSRTTEKPVAPPATAK